MGDDRSPRRIRREWRTVITMVKMYCRRHHRPEVPCRSCGELLTYARRRLDRCPYGVDKPTYGNCPIHCYRADERARMREIMQWAGPRMLCRHPVLAVMHLVDSRRPPPALPRARAGTAITPRPSGR